MIAPHRLALAALGAGLVLAGALGLDWGWLPRYLPLLADGLFTTLWMLAASVALLQVRVQRLGQQHRRGGVAAQVALERGKAEAGRVVVLEQRGAVDHRVHAAKVRHHPGQQGTHSSLVFKIGIKMGAGACQACASSYGFNSIVL